jgi:hypothetical protein
VKGTPASGKSVLARLLMAHIKDKNPEALVIGIFEGWPDQQVLDSYMPDGTWLLGAFGWNKNPRSFLLIDEAQTSYHDSAFWQRIKSIEEEARYHVITFASFGSVTTTPHTPTMSQVVGL